MKFDLASFVIGHLAQVDITCQNVFVRSENEVNRAIRIILRSLAYQLAILAEFISSNIPVCIFVASRRKHEFTVSFQKLEERQFLINSIPIEGNVDDIRRYVSNSRLQYSVSFHFFI